MMQQKTYSTVSGVVFLLIAIGHVLRLVFHWPAVFAGYTVPVWGSVFPVIFFGYLAFEGLRLACKS